MRINGLQLQSGTTYFTTIVAVAFNGLTTSRCTDGITVDFTPPNVPADWLIDLSERSLSWRAFNDPESFVASYEVCLGSYPGGRDVAACSTVAPANGALVLHLIPVLQDRRWTEGETVYASWRVNNRAGLSTYTSSSFQYRR